MLNFFSEKNTQLMWADVEDNLILYINSRTEVPSIGTDELIRAFDTIQQNIVTRMNASFSIQWHLKKWEQLSKRCIWKAQQNHYL